MSPISRRSFIPIRGTALLGAASLSLGKKELIINNNSSSIKPARLKRGDTIAICAPAGAMENSNDIDKFKVILESLGLNVKVGENIPKRFGYFSASDQERASEFMSFISDDEVHGIFFIRGGWGCARILDIIDFDEIQANPKVIMGFSDITSLLNAITAKTGLVTFHGPGGNSTWNDYSVNYIRQLIFEGKKVKYKNLQSDHSITTYSNGIVTGELFGGNLSILCSLIGSKYLPEWKGKILFIEDVMEEPYRIDRMLFQLKLSGLLDEVNGVILGSFRKCTPKEPEKSFTLEQVFEQHFSTFNKPVFYGAQIGHVRDKFTLPIGVIASMNASSGTITLVEPSVV
jgi:muramoyltetrapeptide carboxypeptidase